MKVVDFNKLADWGLVYKINKEILHPLGLALHYETEKGISTGAIIDDQDFKWDFDPELEKAKELVFEEFKKNNVEVLKKELD